MLIFIRCGLLLALLFFFIFFALIIIFFVIGQVVKEQRLIGDASIMEAYPWFDLFVTRCSLSWTGTVFTLFRIGL